MTETRIFPDVDALSGEAAELAFGEIASALEARGRAAVVLSGGSTPAESYRLLSRRILERRLPVERLLWIIGDERWVPVSDPQSNEGMARRMLLDPIRAPETSVLSWRAGQGEPIDCARRFQDKLHEKPDLVLLGMGADGHTASLFPGSRAVLPDGREMPVCPEIPADCAAIALPAGDKWRLTLCPRFMNGARVVAFLVSGAAKRDALRRAVRGDPTAPASWVRGQKTLFLVTRDATSDRPPDYLPGVRFV